MNCFLSDVVVCRVRDLLCDVVCFAFFVCLCVMCVFVRFLVHVCPCVFTVIYSLELCGVRLFVFMCEWFRCLMRLCVLRGCCSMCVRCVWC